MTEDDATPTTENSMASNELSPDAAELMSALTDDAFLNRLYSTIHQAIEDYAATAPEHDVDANDVDAMAASLTDAIRYRARHPQPAAPQTVNEATLSTADEPAVTAEIETVALVNGLTAIVDALSAHTQEAVELEAALRRDQHSDATRDLTASEALTRVNEIEREVHDLLAEPVVRRDDAIAAVTEEGN